MRFMYFVCEVCESSCHHVILAHASVVDCVVFKNANGRNVSLRNRCQTEIGSKCNGTAAIIRIHLLVTVSRLFRIKLHFYSRSSNENFEWKIAFGKIYLEQNATNGSDTHQQNRSTRFPPKRHQQMTQFRSMDRTSVCVFITCECSCKTLRQNTHKSWQSDFISANREPACTRCSSNQISRLMRNVCHTHSFTSCSCSSKQNCENGMVRIGVIHTIAAGRDVEFGSTINKREN